MALEPIDATAEDDLELATKRRAFWTGAVFTVPLFALAMSPLVPGQPLDTVLPPSWNRWLQLTLATPVLLWSGSPILRRGWESVRRRSLNMFSLISMGVTAAFLFSLFALLVPESVPQAFRDSEGALPLYFEAAAMILTLVALGQYLEQLARRKTGDAIRSLMDLSPKQARLLRADGDEQDVALDEVGIGDRLRVRPGETVPVDGAVLDGHGVVDESMMTGESRPVEKVPGDPLFGGTLNRSGAFVMLAERVGAESLLSRIISQVSEAQRSRAPVQKLADTMAGYFVPSVIAIACLSFAVWFLWGPEPSAAHGLVAAVSVLIIACPCALGLATPMSIRFAAGRGATIGVLFRDAEAIELMHAVDTLVVDKTGTVTEGRPAVMRIDALPGFDESGLLGYAAALERASEHPLAEAILRDAKARGIAIPDATEIESEIGHGVRGKVSGLEITLGNGRMFAEAGISTEPIEEAAAALRERGQTAVYVALDGRLAGLIGIADTVRAGASDAIRALHREGVRVVMLTGDHKATATAIAREVGIVEFGADVLPDQKTTVVKQLQDEGCIVAVAGDGINDAPALAQAQVGVAMGTGTDIAMESASVTLVKSDLGALVRARRLSRASMRNIRQNLLFAFVYNALGVPVAAGALYPAFGLLLDPMIAAGAMSLSSLCVIANASRLRSVRI